MGRGNGVKVDDGPWSDEGEGVRTTRRRLFDTWGSCSRLRLRWLVGKVRPSSSLLCQESSESCSLEEDGVGSRRFERFLRLCERREERLEEVEG